MQLLIKIPMKHTNTDYINYKCTVPMINLVAHTHTHTNRFLELQIDSAVPVMQLLMTVLLSGFGTYISLITNSQPLNPNLKICGQTHREFWHYWRDSTFKDKQCKVVYHRTRHNKKLEKANIFGWMEI